MNANARGTDSLTDKAISSTTWKW